MLPLCLVLVSVACAGKGCPPGSDDGKPGPDDGDGPMCMVDADCVPEQCCHPTSCVPASQAPDCAAVLCSQECVPGTLDCGQGQCECIGDSCKAVIDNPL